MLANLRQTAELIDTFRTYGARQTYKKGDNIIRLGESPDGIYYIYEGLVKAYDITKAGEENLLIIRKCDEIFPLIWALTGRDRDVVYQALVATTVWKLSPELFAEKVLSQPLAMVPLLDMTIEMYRLHSERILNLEYRSVRERVVSFLLTMAQRFGEQTADGLNLCVPLRHQDIASSINASRETTSREIAVLERQGLITNAQTVFVLKDLKKLTAILA